MSMFCEKDRDTGEYNHFFSNIIAVGMCGAKPHDIVEVEILETTEEECTHWAYKDLIENQFYFIYKTKMVVEICSPDGFKSDIKEGKGVIVPVIINEVVAT